MQLFQNSETKLTQKYKTIKFLDKKKANLNLKVHGIKITIIKIIISNKVA
jgi:hypothetical protein